MTYDADVADRVRDLLAGERDLTEKKMFGGLAFLVAGNMAVAASGQGGLLVRVDPTGSDRLTQTTTARFMEMRGRAMHGWLRIESSDVRTKRELAKWSRWDRGTHGRFLRSSRKPGWRSDDRQQPFQNV